MRRRQWRVRRPRLITHHSSLITHFPEMSMTRTLAASILLALAGSASGQDVKLNVKVEDTAPPKELSEAVRAVLDTKALNVSDEKGKLLCTIWPVKSIESKDGADQVKAGLKYSNLEETSLVGAVKLADTWLDYRKTKIKPGVYTLRLSIQLMDGDHMGTAPYNEFCLLSPAAMDEKAEAMDVKALHKLSGSSTGGTHPAVMLLFPNQKPLDAPKTEDKGNGIWALNVKRGVDAGGQKASLGFAFVIAGHTAE